MIHDIYMILIMFFFAFKVYFSVVQLLSKQNVDLCTWRYQSIREYQCHGGVRMCKHSLVSSLRLITADPGSLRHLISPYKLTNHSSVFCLMITNWPIRAQCCTCLLWNVISITSSETWDLPVSVCVCVDDISWAGECVGWWNLVMCSRWWWNIWIIQHIRSPSLI